MEALVAYEAGELPADQEERLQDHLALCPECTRLFLDLRDFPNFTPPKGTPRLSDADVAAAWDTFRTRLEEAGTGREEPKPPSPSPAAAQPVAVLTQPREPIHGPARRATALAAVFFLSTIGLSFWVVSLQKKLSQPLADPEVVDFAPTEIEEIERTVGQEKVLAASQSNLLRITPLETEPFPGYELSIQDARTQQELLRRPVSLRSNGDFTLQLPPRYLDPGRYRLTLQGLRDGQQPELLEEFVFRVR